MKIAVVTQIFPVREQPYRGHSVVQTLLQLQRWAEVKVYSPQARYPRWLLPHSRTWASTDLTYLPEGLRAQYYAYPAVPVLTRPFNAHLCAGRLLPLLQQDVPDVILSYWVYPDGGAAVRAGRKLGVPVVVKTVGSDLNQATDAISRALIKGVLHDADAVLTVSRHLRNKVLSMGIAAEKVRAIPNGCDTSVFRMHDRAAVRGELGIGPDVPLILYVGRFDLAKGLDELLRAVASLGSQWPGIKVALIGDGPARGHLQALASELAIPERVIMAGPLRSPEVARWMAAATVVTLPSYREGCPNVVLEALSCGRPVVGTNVGGIPELVNDQCGVLVPPRDASALAAGLHSALERPWDTETIARNMQRGWEQVAAETLEVCSSVVTGKVARAEESVSLSASVR